MNLEEKKALKHAFIYTKTALSLSRSFKESQKYVKDMKKTVGDTLDYAIEVWSEYGASIVPCLQRLNLRTQKRFKSILGEQE